ncbi:MAG: amidohydrolase family protein [Sorangiineae bacterium]|nr:amidohydrolase family protein [Polyangiaceae bacterium]MEB2324441.1 amidohydrolase family protein [Sorangiineae bacterium]
MSEYRAVDCLFPLLLKEWKQSWVNATNSPGELKCKVEQSWGDGYADGAELIAAMDAAKIETVLATDLLAWSYMRQTRFALDMTETIAKLTKEYPGRVYGLADYDPMHIRESLEKLDRDVSERGYRGVYIHIYGYDIPLDHRKMYPLYARCEQLGLPVQMQVGHVLEAMPSEHGHPMVLDRIACDFPNLTLVGTHTGWPWVDEMLAVTTKWPNVYLNVSAWLPRYFSPALTTFMKSRTGAQKVIFGSNGLSWERYLQQFDELELRPEALEAILSGNAKRVFKL